MSTRMTSLSLALIVLTSATGSTLLSSAFAPNHAYAMRPSSLILPATLSTPDVPRDGENTNDGDFKTEVIIPTLADDENVKGVSFFMHGFSQYPKAYRATLMQAADEAKIAVIGVETGIISSEVVKNIVKAKGKGAKDKQYYLQQAVSEDTEQCIRMVKDNDEIFEKLGVPGVGLPMGLIGHSMGGGLCFSVASKFPEINHLFVMAPVEGVEEYAVKAAVQKKAPNQSMLLAGSWDLIARAGKIKKMSDECNAQNPDSSLYVEIKRGIHTGFEDTLVLFNLNLTKAASLVFLILDVANFTTELLIKIFDLVFENTGQLEASKTLLSYFMTNMANGGTISKEEALGALKDDPDMKESWNDKVQIM